MRRFIGTSVVLAFTTLVMGGVAAPALAAPGTRVAFVVDVPFSGTETIVVSSIPGCASGTVTTTGDAAFNGPIGRFFGTKVFDCGSSGTFTLAYNANTFFCTPTDSGTWKIVEGTGDYAGMTGQGLLTGTFFGGDSCGAEGVLDSYTGTLRL
ncbi:MAG TPA: hypothetical protein VNN79_12490 [Actinomycetota bacterium]|nr:hypothetical protein [Actinomycetota bacterium]